MQIQKKQPSSPFIIWATGKMQYNKTRSIEGRYRFWEFAVSVYMVWCTMQWSGFEGIGFGSSLYRFPCFQGINTNKDLLWKDFCMNLFDPFCLLLIPTLPNSCHALPVSAMVLEKGHLPLPAQLDQALVWSPAPETTGKKRYVMQWRQWNREII